MFMMRNIQRSIMRNSGRSILFIVASLFLLCFSGIYMSSIWNNESLLSSMGEKIPVSANLTNPDGSRDIGLSIAPKKADSLLALGIVKPILTAESYGNIDKAKMNLGSERISVYMMGTNTMDAFAFDKDALEAAEPLSFLDGREAKCILSREYAQRRDLQVDVGSVLEINLYKAKYDQSGSTFKYVEVGPAQLTVAGFYAGQLTGVESEAPDIICPVNWLRAQYESLDAAFEYGSFQFTIADPLHLNEFKEAAKALKFKEVNAQANFSRTGSALSVNDKVFVEAASQIMRNLRMLRLFLIPVFLILLILVTLISFFLTRSRRREISIAQCLGRKRASILLELVLENCLLALAGGLLAAAFLFPVAQLQGASYLAILLLFMACELIGSLLSAFLLTRVNPMELLTRVD